MPALICLDCRIVHHNSGTRCPTCQRNHERNRDHGQRSPDTRRRPGRYGAGYTANRRALLADDPPCVYCGKPADTADHILPVAMGGTHELTNLVPACKACNSARGNSLDEQWSACWPTPQPPHMP